MKDLGQGKLDTLLVGFNAVGGQGANIALIKNNASLGAKIATRFSEIE